MPSSVNARAGTACRSRYTPCGATDSTGDIALDLKGVPPGFTLGGGLLPANQDKVRLTLTVPPTPTEKPVDLSLEGRAMIRGREVSRLAVPAEDMIQAFAYHQLVPAKQWLVMVAERRGANYWWNSAENKRMRLAAGKTAHVRFLAPPAALADRVHLTLSEPPDGLEIQNVQSGRNSVDITLRADKTKVKPGLSGNLILEATIDVTPGAAQGKPAGEKRRISIGMLPAVPFEIGPP